MHHTLRTLQRSLLKSYLKLTYSYPFSIYLLSKSLSISNQLHWSMLRCLSKVDYLPRLIFLLTFTTSAKRAATTASVIPNTIIIVTLSFFNYSLFNLFECKGNAFLCAYTFFLRENFKNGRFLDFHQIMSCGNGQFGRNYVLWTRLPVTIICICSTFALLNSRSRKSNTKC